MAEQGTASGQSWFVRHWKVVVPVGCLGLIGLTVACLGVLFSVIMGGIKSSQPAEMAVERARTHPAVIQALGEPVEQGWWVSGSINVSDASGEAELSMPVSGPLGEGKLYLIAKKRAGRWEFELLEVEVKGRAERIDLLPIHHDREAMMLVVHVYVHVKPESVEAFREASIHNATQSLKEPGVSRFDVIQQIDDPTRFMLVEVYRTAEDPARHKQTEHYESWRDTVADMMAEPRRALKYHNAFPADPGWETTGV